MPVAKRVVGPASGGRQRARAQGVTPPSPERITRVGRTWRPL